MFELPRDYPNEHTGKVFTRIIEKRLRERLEETIGQETQHDFGKSRRSQDLTFTMIELSEKLQRKIKKYTYVLLIYKKALIK